MIFEGLYESAQKGELICVDGGMLRYHVRRDRQLTIHEVISTRRIGLDRGGVGDMLWNQLMRVEGWDCIVARCPADLSGNGWYRKHGFVLSKTETTKKGRALNVWRYENGS